MDRYPPLYPARDRKVRKPNPKGICATFAILFLGAPLGACNNGSATAVQQDTFVRTDVVQPRARQYSVTLTGDVQARFRADLSFRVGGRVRERLVDVGAHVDAGEVLARIDSAEQQADFEAASAAVTAAQAQLRVARATFDRQSRLIAAGFTTRVLFDQAQEALRIAEGSLEATNSQLSMAKETLGYTELRADAAGVITGRNLEIGQVVQAGQPVFSLAQDGDRDAVFDVYESAFFANFDWGSVSLTLVSDPGVKAIGDVREVSPAINAKSATIRVKVTIQNPVAAMRLGSAVAGTIEWKEPVAQIVLPWTALMSTGSKPAVWVVEPSNRTALLKPVTVARYEAGAVVIQDGLEPGERVVVDGGKLLSSGQPVSYADSPS
jgi:membrane fusion protein, multidrug efflux system